MKTSTGKVKWFNPSKGYGFIIPDDGGPDIFVHVSALEKAKIKDLKEGQAVQYDISERGSNRSAVNLILITNSG